MKLSDIAERYNPTFAAVKGRFHLLTWGNGPCCA